MRWTSLWTVMGVAFLGIALAHSASGEELRGDYLETRTCDIYTGPCFANSEVGLTGREALLAWSIDAGSFDGVDLTGLRVAMAVSGSDTLGFGGPLVVHPDPIKAVVLVDERADTRQREALVGFVRARAGRVSENIVRVDAVAIEWRMNQVQKTATVKAGREIEITTRALHSGDQCCTNEIVFYPPLADVQNESPAFTLTGKFAGRSLGVRWSSPGTRSAFVATFGY